MSALMLFRKTNCKNSWVVAGLHWPSSITWRWSLWYTLKGTLIPKVGYHLINGYGQLHVAWIFGVFSLNWQPNMWRSK